MIEKDDWESQVKETMDHQSVENQKSSSASPEVEHEQNQDTHIDPDALFEQWAQEEAQTKQPDGVVTNGGQSAEGGDT